MRRAAILLLFALPAFAAEPSKFTLAQSGATADPLTVLGPAAPCADQQIALWNGASNTSLQCSALTVADTTGTITFPAAGVLDWTDATILRDGAAGVLAQRSGTQAQSFRLFATYATAGANQAYLGIVATDGTMTIAPVTAGTAADDQNLVVKGEGPTATLTLDGSDDVAGSVTVTGAGGVTASLNVQSNANLVIGNDSGAIYSAGNANSYFLWGSTPNNLFIPDGTEDVGWVTRAYSGQTADLYQFQDSSSNVTASFGPLGEFISRRKVTPDIDGETTTAAQSGTVFTNTGDGDGEAITLLNDPGIGVQYCFGVDVAQTITVAPSTGETLYYGTDNCVASLTSNAIGSTLCVTAITGGSGAKWFTISDTGSWTCND